jgi:hypothetical protein
LISAFSWSANAPVARTIRSVDLDQQAEKRADWMKTSRIYMITEVRLFIDQKEVPVFPDLIRIISPLTGQFLNQEELDKLLSDLKPILRKESPSYKGCAILLEKGVLNIQLKT